MLHQPALFRVVSTYRSSTSVAPEHFQGIVPLGTDRCLQCSIVTYRLAPSPLHSALRLWSLWLLPVPVKLRSVLGRQLHFGVHGGRREGNARCLAG